MGYFSRNFLEHYYITDYCFKCQPTCTQPADVLPEKVLLFFFSIPTHYKQHCCLWGTRMCSSCSITRLKCGSRWLKVKWCRSVGGSCGILDLHYNSWQLASSCKGRCGGSQIQKKKTLLIQRMCSRKTNHDKRNVQCWKGLFNFQSIPQWCHHTVHNCQWSSGSSFSSTRQT